MARFCEGCGHPMADSATFCDKCGRKAAGLCASCGSAMSPGELFCKKCGARAGTAPAWQAPVPPAHQPPAQPPVPPQARPQQPPAPQPLAGYSQPQPPRSAAAYPQPAPPQRKKSRKGLFLGLGLGALALILIIVVIGITATVLSNPPANTAIANATNPPSQSHVELTPFPEELKVGSEVTVQCDYKSPEFIIPANYRSLDYVVFLQCWTDRGKTKVMVSVEVPGFTQKFEQMVEVSRAETELTIHPPLVDNAAQTLNTSKDAQIVVTVTDLNTNKIVLTDTKPLKLYSLYDMQWEDEAGTPYYENILAWVTPEAKEMDTLQRLAADSCSELTGGAMKDIIGYQSYGDLTMADITYYQVIAMMHAMANKCSVTYINASFSSTSSGLQRIKTPAEVINSAGGLCVETAVTLASVVQRTNMHAVLILLPGHMQTAVEVAPNSGEYYLVETTALSAAAEKNFDNVVIYYKDKNEWAKYLAQEGVVAIDCALAEQLHIKPID